MKQLKIYTYAKKDLEAPKEGVYQLSKGFGEISLLDGKSKGFKLTYKSLTYDFRIYEPSEVHVTLLCTLNEGEKLSAQAMVSLLKAEFLPTQSTPQATVRVDVLAENDQELATNFYVHSFGFTSKKEQTKKKDEKKDEKTGKEDDALQTTYQVVLHCYSPDKKLTINKFCQVFCGKRFGQDIFMQWTAEKFAFLKDQLYCDLKELNHLSYGDKTAELYQPYLVQYNESYYDFLRRVAHRCGEFLYYRKGKLYLGLPQTKDKPGAFSVAAECSYPEVVDEEPIGVEVSSFSGDYVEDRDADVKNKWVYHSPYAGDENLHKLNDDDRDIFTDIWGDWVYFSAAFEALTGENIIEVVQNAATELASIGVGYGFVKEEVEADYEEKYKTNYPEKMGFTPLDVSNCNFLNKFYYQMEQAALKARQSLIMLDCSNLLPKERLGDAFCLGDDTYYVVTRMQGSFEGACAHRIEAVPASYINEKKMKGVTAAPPLQDFPFCLKSAPQEAVVCDAADPLKMGRVRIRYLWQNGDDANSFSPWIRLVVPFASGSGGMVMTPQKGDHLMINYLGENIERPYAEGALYHKGQRYDSGSVTIIKKCFAPNYPARVISSANGHSISFIDLKGWVPFFSGMFPLAGEIMSLVKSCTDSEFDENDSGNAMAGGIVLRDANDINNIQLSADGRFISISSPLGKVSINAFTGISIEAPNGNVSIKGKNITLEAGNNISLKAGGNIHDADDSVKNTIAGAFGSLGGAFLKQAAKETIKYFGLKFDPWKLTDVSFLRAVWEVFMRPVEGSLKLQTNRNVVMTAGEGAVTVPASLVSRAKKSATKKPIKEMTDVKEEVPKVNVILSVLKDYYAAIHSFEVDAYKEAETFVDSARSAASALRNIPNNELEEGIKGDLMGNEERDAVAKAIIEKVLAGTKYSSEQVVNNERLEPHRANVSRFLTYYNLLRASCQRLNEQYNMGDLLKEKLEGIYASYKALPELGACFNCGFDNCLGADYSTVDAWSQWMSGHTWDRAEVTRNLVIKVFHSQIEQIDKLDKERHLADNELQDLDKWNEYIEGITIPSEEKKPGILKSLGVSLANELLIGVELDDNGKPHLSKGIKQLFNIDGEAGPRSKWDVASGGNILLSNSSGITYKLNESSKGWIPMTNPGLSTLKEYLLHLFDANGMPEARI